MITEIKAIFVTGVAHTLQKKKKKNLNLGRDECLKFLFKDLPL